MGLEIQTSFLIFLFIYLAIFIISSLSKLFFIEGICCCNCSRNLVFIFCHVLILQLLCKYEGGSVLKFLEMFDSYRVEHCLRLCQEYGIIDASAFLLERVGDVGSALSLTLSDLYDKFVELDTAVEAVVLNHRRDGSSHMEIFNSVLKTKEVCLSVPETITF